VTLATLAFRISLALGADLTADPATWVYTDFSLRALGQLTWRYGSPDEFTSTTPAEATFRLNNTDGQLTPHNRLSTLFPNVRRQAPVKIELNPGTGYTQVFQGYIDAITPVWPAGNSGYSEISVTASGSLRRLGQGSDSLRSAMYRAIVQSGPVAYWPLEDGTNATSAASALPGGQPLIVTRGKVSFGAAQPPLSSAQLADFSGGGVGGTLTASVPRGPGNQSWRVEFIAKFNAIPAGSFVAVLQWTTSGTIQLWEVDAAPLTDGGLSLQYIDSGGLPGGPFLSNVAVDDTLWHHIRIHAAQSGGNISVTVALDGTTVISQTLTTQTMDQVTWITVNPTGDPEEEVPSLGHLTVWEPFVSSIDTVQAFRGYASETAGDRIVRLCAEEILPVAVSSTTGSARMGPQTVDSFLNLLRECETADGGLLSDGDSAGLTYLARNDRYNQAVTLALDTARSQVKLPFGPVEDDQRIVNDWTVSRPGGSQVQAVDQAHIDANGRIRSSAVVNVQASEDLKDQASWRVHLGTVDEMRVPQLSLQLIDRPELWTAALALRPGDRIIMANPLAQYPAGTVDLICEGIQCVADATSWRMDINCSPAKPWTVGVADSAPVLDCNGSTTNTSLNSTTTSVQVHISDACTWTHASGNFDVYLDNWERVTVTAAGSVTGSSPNLLQTLTVIRSVNGVVKSHASGVEVHVADPLILAL
jgi:hypothetical protein